MPMINKNIGSRRSRLSKFYSVMSDDIPFAYVEAFKILRTNLEFLSSTDEIKSILITSAVPEENKSTTAINLALTFARSKKSVIIVECDMRKPTFQKYLKLGRGNKGLSSILAGKSAIKECIVPMDEFGISVLPAGEIPPNPSELLNQGRMITLIEWLKKQYDYVILDAPPVTVVTDAAIVGRIADGGLLVVRSQYAPTKTLRLAKRRLETVGVRILGVVLTRVEVKKNRWRSGYNYEYTYGQRKKK